MSIKSIWELITKTYSDFNEDKVPRLSAALAYYTIFSLAPLLIIVIAIVSLILGSQQNVQSQLMGQIRSLIGDQGAQLIQTMIENARRPQSGILATVVGVVTLLLGAGGVFGQLQDALNTIWEVAPRPGRGIWGVIQDRFVPFSMILGVGFLLLVSLVISTALGSLGNFIGRFMPGTVVLMQAADFLISFIVITLLFALIFKFLPDVKIAWSDVWIGAAITSLLFAVGRYLIGLYLGRSSTASAYGAAGSLVVLLLWVYYSALILFIGAEFTQVYANNFGSHMAPAANAVPVTEEALAQQGQPHQEYVAAMAEKQDKEKASRQDKQQGERQEPIAPPGQEPAPAAPTSAASRPVSPGFAAAGILSFIVGVSAGVFVALNTVRKPK